MPARLMLPRRNPSRSQLSSPENKGRVSKGGVELSKPSSAEFYEEKDCQTNTVYLILLILDILVCVTLFLSLLFVFFFFFVFNTRMANKATL